MKDSCSSISKLLEKYFDREVTEAERSLVEAHLLDCHACQDALKSMEMLGDLVKAPVDEAVEKEDFPWVWQKIERGIGSEKRPTFWETLQSWLQISPQRKVWVPALAAVAVVLLITIPLLFKKTPSYPSLSVVEYVESQTHNVMIYESENSKVTVIWLFEEPEEETPSS